MRRTVRSRAGRWQARGIAARGAIGLPLVVALVIGTLRTSEAGAQQPGGPAAPSVEGPKVGLDKLLKLPSSLEVDVDKRGGATRSEWRSRFREARADSERARAALTKAQSKLEGAAAESDSPWRMAAPGANTSAESTERYPLTLEVKRQRAEVERTDRRLRELEVEANLAGVPQDWRE